jgi:ankyrin repeat protein
VNTRDEKYQGKTALHVASLPGYPTLVALLLDRGADPTLRVSGNFDEPLTEATPQDWAAFGKARGWGVLFPSNGSGKHDEVIRLLTLAGR